jgi:hypothetical protein
LMLAGAVVGAFLLRFGLAWTIAAAGIIHALALAGFLSSKVPA